MKNKGFTLVELLAVISILGLITVITVPKINNSIEKSKKNISEVSALNYIKKIDEYILESKAKKENIKLNGIYNINESGNIYNETEQHQIKITGDKPKNGILTYNNNNLQTACITINKYKITIENEEITSSNKGDCTISN